MFSLNKKPKLEGHVFIRTTHVVAVLQWFAGYMHIVLYSKHCQNPFRGFWATGGSKLGHSYYFAYWLLQQLVILYKLRCLSKMEEIVCSQQWLPVQHIGWCYECHYFTNLGYYAIMSCKQWITPIYLLKRSILNLVSKCSILQMGYHKSFFSHWCFHHLICTVGE